MRIIKNAISLHFPDSLFLSSTSNENNTDSDILRMGERLAQEVISFIREWCPLGNLGRLSFIGHSLGGLIIRAALPNLREYRQKLHLYLSLATPHLGYMYNSSKIVDAGMWVLKKWKKSTCLQQLSLADSEEPRHSLLYKLSMFDGINWFPHVILLGSYQDTYAPYDSARIEVGDKVLADTNLGPIYKEMTENILDSLQSDAMIRLDVDFKIGSRSIDSFIGRAAHIQFLENFPLMQILIFRYYEIFS